MATSGPTGDTASRRSSAESSPNRNSAPPDRSRVRKWCFWNCSLSKRGHEESVQEPPGRSCRERQNGFIRPMGGDDEPRYRSSPGSRYPATCCPCPDSNASSFRVESGRRGRFALLTARFRRLTEFCDANEPFILALRNLCENTTSGEKSEAIMSLPK